MTIHWQYSSNGIKAAYVSIRPDSLDFKLRLALGMGVFREIKPVKETTQIDSCVPYIIEREDGTMIYVAPQTCIVDTSCRVIVPQEGDHVFVGIDSKLNKPRQTVEDLVENVLIPVHLKDGGFTPIQSERLDIPAELLGFN